MPLSLAVAHRLASKPSPDTDPVACYLARCMPYSRIKIRQRLNQVAQLLSNGTCKAGNLAWWSLRYVEDNVAPARVANWLTGSTALSVGVGVGV